jgi:hypothetical protein
MATMGQSASKSRFGVGLSPTLLISLATPGVILAVLGGKFVAHSITELGGWSEDLLRGDRLPVIPLHDSNLGLPQSSAFRNHPSAHTMKY